MIFRKGCRVPFPEKIREGYIPDDLGFTANVGAEKLKPLMSHFIRCHAEPLFFILELPSNLNTEQEIRPGVLEGFHKDVYYIDGCTQEDAQTLWNALSGLLIQDGMCSFGFGGHRSHEELLVGKYNVVALFTKSAAAYRGFFEEHGIPLDPDLVTAWQTFTRDAPGECSLIRVNGKSVYDLPEILKEWGIYLAERREM